MEKTVRVLWSDLALELGRAAMKAVKTHHVPGVQITGGVSRFDYQAAATDQKGRSLPSELADEDLQWYIYDDLNNPFMDGPLSDDYDAVVSFDCTDVFDDVLERALWMSVPLVVGTALTTGQIMSLRSASERIPVFYDVNYRSGLKQLADRAASLSQSQRMPDLVETLYEGKSSPSEIGKMLQRRILRASGQLINIESRHWYPKESFVCDWSFPETNLHYQTAGCEDLAVDVLKIAKVLVTKPARGEFYNLDTIWTDL